MAFTVVTWMRIMLGGTIGGVSSAVTRAGSPRGEHSTTSTGMMLPGLRDWAFSIKTFAGAMLALWIALSIDLDRPYWAMATAYIVAQPLSGAMRSKSVYRFWGTVL